jgi:hypothetical protein
MNVKWQPLNDGGGKHKELKKYWKEREVFELPYFVKWNLIN